MVPTLNKNIKLTRKKVICYLVFSSVSHVASGPDWSAMHQPTWNVFPHFLIKFGKSTFTVLFRVMHFQMFFKLLVLKLSTLVPPLQITVCCILNMSPFYAVESTRLKYYQIADMLLALSESREINFFSSSLTSSSSPLLKQKLPGAAQRNFLWWLLEQWRKLISSV